MKPITLLFAFGVFLTLVGCSDNYLMYRVEVLGKYGGTETWNIVYRERGRVVTALNIQGGFPDTSKYQVLYEHMWFGTPRVITIYNDSSGTEFSSFVVNPHNSYWSPYWNRAMVLVATKKFDEYGEAP